MQFREGLLHQAMREKQVRHPIPVSYTHLRAHETEADLVCRLLLEAVGESHQCLVSATHLEGFGGGWQQQAQILGARDLRPDLKIG